jgi:hypothetical protein
LKYNVEAQSNTAFIQIVGTSETLKSSEYAVAFQTRGGSEIVSRLLSVLDDYTAQAAEIEVQFHDVPAQRQRFEQGFVVFQPGEPPILLMAHRRTVSLLIGHQPFGSGIVFDVPALQLALRRFLAKAEKAEQRQRLQTAGE